MIITVSNGIMIVVSSSTNPYSNNVLNQLKHKNHPCLVCVERNAKNTERQQKIGKKTNGNSARHIQDGKLLRVLLLSYYVGIVTKVRRRRSAVVVNNGKVNDKVYQKTDQPLDFLHLIHDFPVGSYLNSLTV